MKIYLDNCCYNRPYDDQTQISIRLETQAKLQVQAKIKIGVLDLVWSYILDYENGKNPFTDKKDAIQRWKSFAVEQVDESEAILTYAESLASQGILII